MNKKNKVNYENLEREYTINLRKQVDVVPRYRKTEKAVKTIKEFIAKHMKVPERNLKNVRLDRYLNEYMWGRGIKNPPMKIKVKAKREKEIVKVELAEMPKDLEFKKKREEKRHASEKSKEKKEEKTEDKEVKVEETEKEKEAREKEKTSAEATEKIEKFIEKEMKHETKLQKPNQKGHSKGKMGF
jgi:large subunit ribosomal protein L31e